MDENNDENTLKTSSNLQDTEKTINQSSDSSQARTLNTDANNGIDQHPQKVQENIELQEPVVQAPSADKAYQRTEAVDNYPPQTIVTSNDNVKQDRDGLKKILILGVLLALVAGLVFVGYILLQRSDSNAITKNIVFVDDQYGFQLNSTAGWTEIDPQPGVYRAFGTEKDGRVFSYVGIVPIVKSQNKENSDFYRINCEELISDINGSFIKFSEIVIGQLSGYRCDFEAKGVNLNEQLNASIITLLGNLDGKYDYVISTSYPQSESGEMVKVDNFVNSFYLY